MTNKLPSFSKKKKGAIVAILLLTVMICASYALIVTQWTVSHHLKILGGAIELWQWEDPETYSLTYEVDDCEGIIPGESWESRLLVLAVGSDCSIDQILSFDTTLPDNVGYILWQVEVAHAQSGWKWYNWTEGRINVNADIEFWVYLLGTPNNPIEPLQKIGLRSGSPSQGDTGHLKYTVYTYETAPCADYPFEIIVTGTEA